MWVLLEFSERSSMTYKLISADSFTGNLFIEKFLLENAIFVQWACKCRPGYKQSIYSCKYDELMKPFIFKE